MSEFLFEYKEISFTTNDNKQLFERLNLQVSEGDKILLQGESGSGKSTLMKMLPGGVKPDSGKIIFQGEAISSMNISRVRNAVFYVSQHPVLGADTPMEVVRLPYMFKNRKDSISEEKIFQLAESFNLERGVFSREIRFLSGGEKQRLAIIRALCSGAKIFLLDEITHSLDPDTSEKVISYFFNSSYTVLSVSHDKLWADYFTRNLILKKGCLSVNGD